MQRKKSDRIILQDSVVLSAISKMICECLPEGEASNFSRQFELAVSICPNINISLIWSKLALWLLIDSTYGTIRYNSQGAEAIARVARLCEQFNAGINPSAEDWVLAAEEARIVAVALVDDKSKEADRKFKAAICACLAAQTMILAKRQEDLQKFGEDGVGHSSTLFAAIEAAFEAGGEEWASQVAIAIRDKFFELMWNSTYSIES